jgi:hypothetical protein
MVTAAVSFGLLELLPVNFAYWVFATLLLIYGLAMGAFVSPNAAAVMSSLPSQHRGAGSGMNSTFRNSATVLSIGIFFTLMIIGLSHQLPISLARGLEAAGVPDSAAQRVAHLPPISTLFAAFLGYNPLQQLLGPTVLGHLNPASQATILSRGYFAGLIAEPFHDGLREAFTFAMVASLVAAAASWLRGGRYVFQEVD